MSDHQLPPLPSSLAHVTRRIKRTSSDAVAEVVLGHFATAYARSAIAPLLADLEASKALEAKLREALTELVECERLKDQIKMDSWLIVETDDDSAEMERTLADHAERQPKAWVAARAALGKSK